VLGKALERSKLRAVARSYVQIMDTTLRDGEQTPNVSYTPAEKFQLAQLLLREVQVDRVEVASARVSDGEAEAVRRIAAWAQKTGNLERVEILGYTDRERSVDWITGNGGKVMNLLTKGSRRHCEQQLRLSPEQHFKEISETVQYARKRGLSVNVFLEDWSNGVRDALDYVFAHVSNLSGLGVQRIFLADTLGILSPTDTEQYVTAMVRMFPALHFEFHGHNDYGLATANALAAVRAGARGVHTSVNGLGERAGNCPLAQLVATLHDLSEHRTRVRENRLVAISEMVATFSGKATAENAPIVGKDVFTQTAGIHADGDSKASLYLNRLVPARFGRRSRYALGKLSGKASLDQNLKDLGIELPARSRDLVLQRIVELGDRKHAVTREDLPHVIADVLATPLEQRIRIASYEVVTRSGSAPSARVELCCGGQTFAASATGDGGYDAFMKALTRAARQNGVKVPALVDYKVRIPPGGKSEALVETVITWRRSARSAPFSTRGVDPDQLAAAVIATEKMLNLVAGRPEGEA
jgi:(R)-citramalate synthase